MNVIFVGDFAVPAEIALTERRHDDAIGELRLTLGIWREAGSRINVAHTRLRLTEVFAQSGDGDEAELELSAAQKAFSKMEAEPMVERCEAVRKKILSRRGATR